MQANKALVSLVVGLGFLIIGGAIIIAFGLYKKSTDPSYKFFGGAQDVTGPKKAAGPAGTDFIDLPTGAEIAHMETSGNRLILHVRKKDQSQSILIIDMESGALLKRFSIGGGGGGN